MASMLILSMYSAPMLLQNKDGFNKFSSFELTTEMLKNKTVFDDEVLTYKEKIRDNYSLDQGTIIIILTTKLSIYFRGMLRYPGHTISIGHLGLCFPWKTT